MYSLTEAFSCQIQLQLLSTGWSSSTCKWEEGNHDQKQNHLEEKKVLAFYGLQARMKQIRNSS
jgi:hypothetical protein